MGCTNCKKKKKDVEKLKTTKKPIIEVDSAITWIIVVWFFLGIYGLLNLIGLFLK